MTSPVVGAAVPVTLGATEQLTPPNNVPNVGAVVIQNLSGYLLTISISGSQHSLPAYTADLFPTSGTGGLINVTASNPDNSPAGLPAYVIAQWFTPNDVPPAGYPVALSPPAYALGVAIAEQLLATGIPSVILDETIVEADPITPGSTKTYQVGQYASLSLSLTGVTAARDLALVIGWYTADGTLVDQDYLYALTDLVHVGQLFVRLAVEAAQLKIFNITPFLAPPAPTAINLTMTGSNRPAQRRIDTRSSSTAGARFAYVGAIGAGGTVVMLPDSALGAQVSGQATATFKVTGTATGRIDLVTGIDTGTATLHTVTVCDTAEMITNANGNLYLVRQLQLPESGFGFRFTAVAGQAAGTVSVDLLI